MFVEKVWVSPQRTGRVMLSPAHRDLGCSTHRLGASDKPHKKERKAWGDHSVVGVQQTVMKDQPGLETAIGNIGNKTSW